MSNDSLSPLVTKRFFWRPFFVLGSALILTLCVTFFVARAAYNEDLLRFESLLQHKHGAIVSHLETHIALLRGAAGLLAAHEAQLSPHIKPANVLDQLVTRQAFHEYVDRLRLKKNYPGIQGVGISVRVPASQKTAFLPAARDQHQKFKFWPDPLPPGAGPDYHAILYLEPMDARNKKAIGYNMFSEPVRRAAMQQAMDSGEATASGKVILVQEITQQKQAGFLIYLPIYRDGITPSTVRERRANLLGFVYSPFRAGDFLSSALAADRQGNIAIRFYSAPQFTPENLLYQSPKRQQSAFFARNLTFNAAGRAWGLTIETLPNFLSGPKIMLVPAVLIIGLLISAILFVVTWQQAKAHAEAEAVAAELRRSEEQRSRLLESERAARLQAETANRAKDEFLATVSHELRTPLTSILGWAHLIAHSPLDDDSARRGLQTIERNAKAQAQLIEDLLDMSRIISGKIRLDMRPLYIAPVLDAALDAVRPAAEAKAIALVRDYTAENSRVTGDPDRLQQVIWNLLTNAIKFTPRGGQVKVSLTSLGSHLEIAVNDSGIGMEPDFVPFAFDRFSQADGSATRKHGGLGLGLAIVRHLVEMHGGDVRAASEGEGRGSTFFVRLPILQLPAIAPPDTTGGASVGEDNSLPSHEDVKPSLTALQDVKVLVVDDEADARGMIQAVLELHGAQVEAAASASEAMQVLGHWQPQLLISDIGLPGEDGYALIHKIRRLPDNDEKTLPAIALTAYARESDRTAALAAGFQLHLSKPISPRHLVTAVASLLEQEPTIKET